MRLKFLFRRYHQVALIHYKIKPLEYELVVNMHGEKWNNYYETLSCQPLGDDHRTHGWYTYKIKKL